MNKLMECLKRSDKQGILRVVQRDYVLKEKVKKIIEERIRRKLRKGKLSKKIPIGKETKLNMVLFIAI